jgi:hypothetical protein
MLNDQMAVSCVPYNNLVMGIECAPQQTTITKQYVRDGPVPANADARLYDLGQVYVAVDGIQGTAGTTVTLGELWVSYDIILMKSSLALMAGPGPSPDPTPTGERRLQVYGTGDFAANPCNWPTTIWPQAFAITIPENSLGATLNANTLTLPAIGGTGSRNYIVCVTWGNSVGNPCASKVLPGGIGNTMDYGTSVHLPSSWTITNGAIVTPDQVTFASSGVGVASTTQCTLTLNKLGGAFYIHPIDTTLPVIVTMPASGNTLQVPNLNNSGGSTNSYWSVQAWVT